MTVGLHTANLANKILDHFRGGTAWTQPSGIYAQLHTGDPGSAGTANQSAVTTRIRVNFAAAASGAIAETGTAPVWTMTTTETISHLSFWDAITAGNVVCSSQAAAARGVISGDTVTLNTCGISLGPLMA
jgi:hypothetical protein